MWGQPWWEGLARSHRCVGLGKEEEEGRTRVEQAEGSRSVPECRTGRQGSAVSASCGWKWGEALWWREERAAVQGEAVSDRVRGGEKSITIG